MSNRLVPVSVVLNMKIRMMIEVRKEQGAEADYDLYEKISDAPGSSGYQLAKLMGWSTGRTNSAIARLEKKGLIKVERREIQKREKLARQYSLYIIRH